jgi:hypothetical protein
VTVARGAAVALALLCAVAARATGPLETRVTTVTLQLPHALEHGATSRCTWNPCTLGPRLYLAPRSNGTFLVGWTDSSGNGHVSVVSGGTITATHNFPNRLVRGLVAHDDGTYAVLLKEGVVLHLSKRAATGSQLWITNINSALSEDSSRLGDHRLAYGGGTYAAYWAVHGFDGWVAGHEGDELRYVSDTGVVQSGGWTWGCSHSMAELVGYHPGDRTFSNFCSTDCYPDPPGLKMNHSTRVFDAAGDCRGGVSLQLGQMAAAEAGWKVVFNAMDSAGSTAYGIGLASTGGGSPPQVTWLTDTDGSQERDPVLARLGQGTPERYLVGWRLETAGTFHLGVIDGLGTFLEGPEMLSPAGPRWGMRDDSFRSLGDGSVAWIQGASNSTTLKLHRYAATMIFGDGFESGATASWSSAAD